MPLLRYFQPSSQTMKTTLPSSISSATRTAILAIAPLETPAKMPSSSSSLRVQTIASSLVTQISPSSRARSLIGGRQRARPDDRSRGGHEDRAVQQGEIDERRDEAVVEGPQALDGLALLGLRG